MKWSAAVVVLMGIAATLAGAPPTGVSVSPKRVTLSPIDSIAPVTVRNDGDAAVKLKLSVSAWTNDDDGRPVYSDSTDVEVAPAALTIEPKSSAVVTLTAKNRPRGSEWAYRLFVDDAAAPAATPAPAASPSPAATPAPLPAPTDERLFVPIFLRLGAAIGVPVVESLMVEGGEMLMVVRNIGSGAMLIQSAKIRGVSDGGRDVFETPLDGGYVLAQRRRVYHLPIDPAQCGKIRQVVGQVATPETGAMRFAFVTPASCPAAAKAKSGIN